MADPTSGEERQSAALGTRAPTLAAHRPETMLAGTLEVDYQVKRDKVILTNHGANVVLRRHEDGTLEGPMGRMKRKGS